MFLLPQKYLKFLLATLGGLLAGLGLSQGVVLLVWIGLAILWSSREFPWMGLIWGAVATLVSHRWLLSIHPLTWLGVPQSLSLPISILIWLSCGLLGSSLVGIWSLFGNISFFKKTFNRSFGWQFLNAFTLSLIWGLAEVTLSKSPLFWFGVGGSLLPGDRWLAGLARWFGEGGLATMQLLIGWWLWKISNAIKSRLPWIRIFISGFLVIVFAHCIGWRVLSNKNFSNSKSVALWQSNIPTREKFSIQQLKRLPVSLNAALESADRLNADLMIAPEGTLPAGQKFLPNPNVSLLSGGFRISEGRQRSSLLFFDKGKSTYSEFIDKHRLVPLGEWLPPLPSFFAKGFSFVGGLEAGDASRFFRWRSSPIAVAICYELSDGNALAKATLNGAQWVLVIANLDPYPISLQRQFLSLAQLRSIELNRDLISVANTGPTSLVLSSGQVQSTLAPFKEELGLVNVGFSNKITGYVRWREMPLIASLIVSILIISRLKKY